MSARAPIKVFISYARKDSSELAHQLCSDLEKQGLEVWLDKRKISGGATWTTEIEEALDNCEVALALLTNGSYVSEVCRAEQLRALRHGKCVIPLRVAKNTELPLHLEAKNYRDFAGGAYEERFAELLDDIAHRKGVELKHEYRMTQYDTVPPFPANYVERRQELMALRNALITEGGGRTIALTALHGMGGIGKTVLAQALCHEAVVQQAFPDGIIWIVAGKEYDLVTKMREVAKALDDDLSRYDTELGCQNQYRTTMRQKAALIVLDDVWSVRDLEPFRAESLRSRLLFTVRDSEIASATGAREYPVQLLDEAQSREVLAKGAVMGTDELPDEAAEIIRECGRLPLALAMVGAMLRGKPHSAWPRILAQLRNADLAKIRAEFPDYPHTDLLRAIQVSVNALDEVSRQRYLKLAVLLDDMKVSPVIQMELWKTGEDDAAETAERFVSRALAQRDEDGIRLHDLQLDYVQVQHPDQRALKLIRGAVRLSAHIFAKDPTQFTSQLIGRLLAYTEQPTIANFINSLKEGAVRPALRPIRSALHPPGTALLRTLAGHSGAINGVALTWDGRCAVSASLDKTLKVWDVESGRELCTLNGHSTAVYGVAVTADGRLAVSGSSDGTVKVWDLASGREIWTSVGHSSQISRVAVTPDGRLAVSASFDATLKVWDLEGGCVLQTLVGHLLRINGVALNANGTRAVSVSDDRALKVWDLESGHVLQTLEGHSSRVNDVAFSANGSRAVSAANDSTLKVWDLETGREPRTLIGHSFGVRTVAVTPNGRWAVSGANDQTIKVWDLEAAREIRTLIGHSSRVNTVAVSADGRRAVSAATDGTLNVWNLEARQEVSVTRRHSSGVLGIVVSADGKRAVSCSADRTLNIWYLEHGDEPRALSGHSSRVHGLAVSRDWHLIISASDDDTLWVWDLESGRKIRTLIGHSSRVNGVAITADGRYAVSASFDAMLKVWDLKSWQEVRTLRGHAASVNGVATTYELQAISASSDTTLKVWDLATGQQLRTLVGHSSGVNAVAVRGRQAISASDDNTLKLWDLESGRELRTLEGHSDRVHGAAISADGRWAVSASLDQTIRLWNIESGHFIATFTCDSAALCCTFASPLKIVAGDASGKIYLLEIDQ